MNLDTGLKETSLLKHKLKYLFHFAIFYVNQDILHRFPRHVLNVNLLELLTVIAIIKSVIHVQENTIIINRDRHTYLRLYVVHKPM